MPITNRFTRYLARHACPMTALRLLAIAGYRLSSRLVLRQLWRTLRSGKPIRDGHMITARYIKVPRCKRLIIWALTLLPMVGAISSSPIAYALDISLGTEAQGTFSHFAGRILCRAINSHANDLNCQTAPTSEQVDTLTNIRGGSLDFGLVDSRMLHDAVNKTGNFEFLDIGYDNLRSLLPLYDTPITLVVRNDAGVNNLDDLKGKRINAGTPRSRESLALNIILNAKNWTRQDFSLVEELPKSQSQDTYALCHGSLQAIIYVGVHPDAKLNQVLQLCDAQLVDMSDNEVEKLVENNLAFSIISIAERTYPSQKNIVTTFGSKATLIASDNLDEETAYKIIDALIENRDQVGRAHPALSSFSPETLENNNPAIPLHPGLSKYIAEHK